MGTGCNTQLKMNLRKWFHVRTPELISQILVFGSLADGTGKERRQTSNVHLCWGLGSWETMKAPTTGL